MRAYRASRDFSSAHSSMRESVDPPIVEEYGPVCGGMAFMNLTVGAEIWLPCEVRPGPFSDERLVRVASETGAVVSFVPASAIREDDDTRRTFVVARIVAVSESTFEARLPGHPVSSAPFLGMIARAERSSAV